MAESLVDELKRYVAFGPADEAALQGLLAVARPRLPAIAEVFYARILAHAEARRALVGGESRAGQLKLTLVRWMTEALGGPWDDAWWESHCRIGRVHVRIDLPQHYMFGAMNVIREQLHAVVVETWPADSDHRRGVEQALDKVLDLELAIMLHTFREDLLAKSSRSERLATFGQLMGSIAHELRNPLGVIESSLYLVRGRVPADERIAKHLDRIGEQVRLSNDIISGLLELIRDRPLRPERVDVAAVARDAAAAVWRPAEVSLAVEGPEGIAVSGEATQLRQALVNLVQNAAEAAAPRGEVVVRWRADGAELALDVEDTGPGVADSVRARLFEPLITTKDHGNGLGLALARRVAERHGGSLSYHPRPAGGARFHLRVPLA